MKPGKHVLGKTQNLSGMERPHAVDCSARACLIVPGYRVGFRTLAEFCLVAERFLGPIPSALLSIMLRDLYQVRERCQYESARLSMPRAQPTSHLR
jgi:hypothetical protein